MSGTTGDQPAVLAEFAVPSEPGNERAVIERVGDACGHLGLPVARLDALGTAVAEATMNAIEHGNGNDASLPVGIGVRVTEGALVVRVTDEGRGGELPADPEVPDIEAKLRGKQSPRGWGLFLMRNTVDDVRVHTDGGRNAVELTVRLAGEDRGSDRGVALA